MTPSLPGLADGKLKDPTPLRRGPLSAALEVLNGEGEETRLVGGAVRDLALGRTAVDFDLTTTATTHEVARRAREAGFKVALTGVAHGTVTIIVDGCPLETTTLREDIETDGRWARVAFSRDFAADARRRDFTMNALSLSADGRIHDYVGGLEDLAARRLRFIGDADVRIREDYLRILRFFRFSSRFAKGDIDRDGLAAAIRGRPGLARISRERVRAELMKILVTSRAGEIVQTMGQSGFLEPILGGIGYTQRLRHLIAIESERGPGADAVLRMAALGVMIAEDADRLQNRLRLANAEAARLKAAAAALVELHGITAAPTLDSLRALMFTAGREAARDALGLAQAESGAQHRDTGFAAADRFLVEEPELKLPVTGADVIARGVVAGTPVGKTLRAARALWIRAGFPMEPDMLAHLLDRAIAETLETEAPEAGRIRGA